MKRVFLNFLFILFVLLGFTLIGFYNLDPDFGWHLRMGQIILHTGIPFKDIFSYTMPFHPFIDHEWGSDIVIAALYPLIGKAGLALLFSFLATLALIFQTGLLHNKSSKVLFLLSVSVFSLFFGVSPQVFSWFFFSLLLVIVRAKAWYFLPFLFLLWANIHGGFFIGLVFLGVISLFQKITKKVIPILMVIISSLVTLVNPYGISLWKEISTTITDSYLKMHIAQWQSLLLYPYGIAIWLFLSFTCVIFYLSWKENMKEEKYTFIFFCIISILSIRNFPFFIILMLAFLLRKIETIIADVKHTQAGRKKLAIAGATSTSIVIITILCQLYTTTVSTIKLSEKNFYPSMAVKFLQNHPIDGNMMSSYDWGGYLIWNYPQKKVFIDGRMPSWQSLSLLPLGSSSILVVYTRIIQGEIPLEDLSSKYGIHTYLLPITAKIDGSDYAGLKSVLIKNKYRQIYADTIAIIYTYP